MLTEKSTSKCKLQKYIHVSVHEASTKCKNPFTTTINIFITKLSRDSFPSYFIALHFHREDYFIRYHITCLVWSIWRISSVYFHVIIIS